MKDDITPALHGDFISIVIFGPHFCRRFRPAPRLSTLLRLIMPRARHWLEVSPKLLALLPGAEQYDDMSFTL